MGKNSTVPSRYRVAFLDNPDIVYDEVTDKSDFKRGQDRERAMRLVGDTGGSPTNGVYDFNSDEDIKDSSKNPTDIQLALRSGQLDKADIDTLKRAQDIQAKQEFDDNQKALAEKKREEINNARQAYLDNATGFDSSSVQAK